MKRFLTIATTASSLLLTNALVAMSKEPYYPYQMYDDYHKSNSVAPPPGYGPPPPPPPPATQELQRPMAKPPLVLTQAPEFLFPPPLGFGVAIGIPYDLFYVSKIYYLYKDGSWFRSASYRGPWTRIPVTGVPPELRRQKLANVRAARNAEFTKYWKNKSGYTGKVFRPDEELPPAQKKPSPPPTR